MWTENSGGEPWNGGSLPHPQSLKYNRGSFGCAYKGDRAKFNGLRPIFNAGSGALQGRTREAFDRGRLFALLALDGLASQLPRGAILEQAGNKCRVHGMAGAFRVHMAFDAAASQGEIPNEVEDLVADVFVGEAQRAVFRAVFAEDNGVFRSGATDEAHVAKPLFVGLVAESAGRGDVRPIGSVRQVDGRPQAPDGGGKIDGVVDAVARPGVDADELVAFAHLHRMQHTNIFAAPPLGANAHAQEGFNIWLGAAVEDGQFQVVDLDNYVIDPHSNEGREEVFGRRNEHALAHEAGGVAELGDIAPGGRDLEVIKIGAAKDNARTRRGGQKPHVHGGAGVKPHSRKRERLGDRLFQMSRLGQIRALQKTI